eukprot:CAMPEP_0172728478 /NCGR_PEP_ID=MMETSP1074-20121228/92259_1 /TAXON_ID=2916 /ORGANISM="Ceratium fusus, Strain PA161109" /LENGTH=450 /DNA_ID=CAMNT_0013555733 /DNA_START=43 /DNA_END=1392 /DNA_ORIENTATION=-
MATARGGSASVNSCAATLLKNIVGAGIFSLPIGLVHATPIPGLAILALVGVLNAGSFWMIGYCCLTWGVGTFRELWNCVLGQSSAWVIDVLIFLNGWFTLVSYVVLIGDFTTKSLSGLLGEEHFFARQRVVDQWGIAILVLLPLSMQKDLSKLKFTSLLGLGVLLYVIFLIIGDACRNAPPQWSDNMVFFERRLGAFEAIAIYCQAYSAHYNAPKLFSELRNPTLYRWFLLVAIAFLSCIVSYSAFALAGIRRWEDSVQGNILKNYDPTVNVLVAWLGMGFCIAFTYPLVFNSMREAAVNLAVAVSSGVTGVLRSPSSQRLFERHNRQRRSPSLVNILGAVPDTRKCGGTGTTVMLVLVTIVVGCRCDDVSLVTALAGSLMGVSVCLVIPALLFIVSIHRQLQRLRTPGTNGHSMSTAEDLTQPLLSLKGRYLPATTDAPRPLLWLAASW